MDSYNPNGTVTGPQAETAGPPSVPTAPPPRAPIGREVEPPKSGGSKGWLIGIIVAVVVVAIGVGLVCFLRPVPTPTATITFAKPDQVLLGDPFPISMIVSGYGAVMKNAKLILQLPPDMSFVGAPPDQRAGEWDLGDLSAGVLANVSSTLIAIGDSESVASLSARLVYNTEAAPSTQFETATSTGVTIGSPAVSLGLTAPPNAVSGSNIVLTLSYANRAPDVISNARIVLKAPPAFTLATSSAAAVKRSNGNLAWNVGNLMPGASGTIVAEGSLTSAAETAYGFTGSVEADFAGQTYVIPGQTASIALSQAPLTLSVLADGSSTYIAAPNDFITYTLGYANHSSVGMQSAVITAKLTGVMFNFSTIATDGSFDSLANTLKWSAVSVPELASLAPGATGEIKFRVRAQKAFPIHRLSDKNYTLRVDGTIFSPTVPPGVAASSTVSNASLSTKLVGSVVITSKGYRYDSASGASNTGPFPPVADRETQYTIHWTVTDTATDLQNVAVAAALPPGVKFINAVKSNVSSTPQYDATTGLITWQIPFVSATAGTAAPAPQAAFQIAATPAVNQVGQYLDLLDKTNILATDAFTNLLLEASADAVNSDLRSDPVASQNHNAVVQAQ